MDAGVPVDKLDNGDPGPGDGGHVHAVGDPPVAHTHSAGGHHWAQHSIMPKFIRSRTWHVESQISLILKIKISALCHLSKSRPLDYEKCVFTPRLLGVR